MSIDEKHLICDASCEEIEFRVPRQKRLGAACTPPRFELDSVGIIMKVAHEATETFAALSQIVDEHNAAYPDKTHGAIFIVYLLCGPITDLPAIQSRSGIHVVQVGYRASSDAIGYIASDAIPRNLHIFYTYGLSSRDLHELSLHGLRAVVFFGGSSIEHTALSLNSIDNVEGIVLLPNCLTDAVSIQGVVSCPVFSIQDSRRTLKRHPRQDFRESLGLTDDDILIGLPHFSLVNDSNGNLIDWITRFISRERVYLLPIPEPIPGDLLSPRCGMSGRLQHHSFEESFRLVHPPLDANLFQMYEACDIYLDTGLRWPSYGTYVARYYETHVVRVGETRGAHRGESWSEVRLTDFKPIKRPTLATALRKPCTKLDQLGWWALHGLSRDWNTDELAGTLFVTSNLGQGGAQRSLVNLLTSIQSSLPVFLLVLNDVIAPDHWDRLKASNIMPCCTASVEEMAEKVRVLLTLARQKKVRTICFWHADLSMKAMIVKLLKNAPVRLIDVSPGPRLFEHMERSPVFREISMEYSEYFERLDRFVMKYAGGGIPERFGRYAPKSIVIPNGVQFVSSRRNSFPPKKDFSFPSRKTVPLSHAVVSCCRLVPAKLVERQLEVAALIRESVPDATLTIVGAPSGKGATNYCKALEEKYKDLHLQDVVFFAGDHTNYRDFLPQFRVFLMLSYYQGCPNASLEAMACGLPVVANPDGGTVEQIVDGKTGFLVPEWDPEIIANRVVTLLSDPALARSMGEAGRERARKIYTLELMAERYTHIL